MKRHKKSFLITLATILVIGSIDVPASAETSNVITWNIPAKWKQDKITVSYGTHISSLPAVIEPNTVMENTDTFNPEVWLETLDDTLTDYVTETDLPVYDTWTNVSDSYNLIAAPNVDRDAKTYMKFQAFGYNSGNIQSHLSRGSYAYTGDYSIRMVDGRMLIAMGTGFSSTIGTYIDIELENGKILACMLGDVKSDMHTDPTHMYQKWDKSIMEFIIDSPGDNVKDYSYFKELYPEIGQGNFNAVEVFNSRIKSVRVYDKIFNVDMNDISNDNPDR